MRLKMHSIHSRGKLDVNYQKPKNLLSLWSNSLLSIYLKFLIMDVHEDFSCKDICCSIVFNI